MSELVAGAVSAGQSTFGSVSELSEAAGKLSSDTKLYSGPGLTGLDTADDEI